MNDFDLKTEDFQQKTGEKEQKTNEKVKIVKIYDFERIVLKITSLKKKMFLPYLLNIYIVLPNQNPEYIRLLRKEGKKISLRKGQYLLLVSKHNISYKSKIKILSRIFELEYRGGKLYDEILKRFIDSANPSVEGQAGFYKSTEYMLILDNLATFLISNNDNSDFLNDRLRRKQKRYELFSYSENVPYEFIPDLIINKKGLYTKHITHRPRMQARRWKKSKTYKLNELIKTLNTGYIAKWCYVNELNEFFHEGVKYRIDDESYHMKKYGRYLFDQILVVNDNGLRFFNMNIEEINKNNILLPFMEQQELSVC